MDARESQSILIAVTAHNRLEYVRTTAGSLALTNNLAGCHVWIFDDCSDDYEEPTLRQLFPFAEYYKRNEHTLGPGGNMKQVFERFLESGLEILMLADSDLVFHPDWVDVVRRVHPATQGVLSIYNSLAHPALETLEKNGERIVRKKDIGAAGTSLSRPTVEAILANVSISDRAYDWRWSRFLVERGVALYSTDRSYVQHIGAIGTNSSGTQVDVGLRFVPGNEFNEAAVMAFYDRLLSVRAEAIEVYANERLQRFKESDLQYRLGRIAKFPLDLLRLVYRFAWGAFRRRNERQR